MQNQIATPDDKTAIDQITTAFFDLFTNMHQKQPDWTRIHALCLPEVIIIKMENDTAVVYNLQTFIEPRKTILSDGTLIDFEEHETQAETTITGHIAQRASQYEKSGYLNGAYFKAYGNKFFQFVKTPGGWKMSALIWEDE